jgi:hypothetical protein
MMLRRLRLMTFAVLMPLSILTQSAEALDLYVSPAGDGSAGTNWATAFTNLQAAVNASAGAGDEIRVRYGTYSNGAEVAVVGKPGLTIRGGYAGTTPEPGDLTNLPTVVTRSTAVSIRIFNGSASTVTLERLTISGGFMVSGNGGACSFTNGCAVVLTNCTIVNNGFQQAAKGGGVYASRGSLVISDCTFTGNYISADTENTKLGGAIACETATVWIANSVFYGNYIRLRHGAAYGGALYLLSGNAVVTGCQFTANSVGGYQSSAAPRGGALYADSVTQLVVTACVLSDNYSTGPNRLANVLFLAGATLNALFDGCTLRDNFYAGSPEDVYLSAAGAVTFRGCTLKGSTAGGVIKAGAGTLTVTNSLIVQNIGHGLNVVAGTVNIAHSTIAANSGLGVTNSGATVSLKDSIVWNNMGGGITGTVTTSYSCLQEARAGTANFVGDPLFIAGYYLSSNGLPAQTVSSPCIDVGSGTAAALGLNGRTTLTDGSGDAGQVDLGYHSTNGSANLSNLILYVNADTGSDGNNGWSAGLPLKTLTNALARVVAGGTINIAAGTYTNGAALESFPLMINTANVTLKGAGAATTFIDARWSGRILMAIGQGALRLEGLTFRNGHVYNDNGAGLYLVGCNTVLTNCTVVSNRINKLNGDSTLRSGAGIYNYGGSLTVAGCQILTNTVYWAGDYTVYAQGGGIYSANASVILRDSTFRGNSVNVKHSDCYGGAVCLSGGDAQISGSTFVSNYLYTAANTSSAYPYGGALYANGVNLLAIDRCTFLTNYSEAAALGGAVYLAQAGKTVQISSTAFLRNRDIYLVSGTVTMTNCLVARSTTKGLRVAGGSVTMVNCTLADNADYGVQNMAGAVTAKHCIAWGNTNAGLYNCTTVTYSDSQDVLAGVGNMVTNPLFADTTYYHLAARAGFYSNGWFSGGTWAVTTNDSPLIDAGDVTESWRDEPQPNGRRINIGAYGGSPVASKTYLEAPGVFSSLTVHSYPATNVDISVAWLNGEVLHTGGQENPAVYFCWGPSDAGTTATSWWANVIDMGTRAQWERFTTNITGFSGTTHYRCYITNSAGEDWSADPAETFTTVSSPAVTNTGATLVRRSSARLNGLITETGGQNPTVWFYYWPDAGSPTSVVAMSQQAGAFYTDLSSLSMGSLYHYRILASNSAEAVWSDTRDFTTLTADPIGRYVAPGGAGAMNGQDWANAYSLVQDALLECTYPGDTIYLRHGAWSNLTQIAVSNVPGLIIRGEYAGSGTPGDRTNLPSVLKAVPPEATYARVLYVAASTVTLDRVTLRDGHLNNSDGAGLYLTNSRATLTNCVLINNRVHDTASATIEKGGGIFAWGGTLELFACQFQTNKVYWSGYSHDAKGGAVYATGAVVTAVGCRFNGNTVGTKHVINYGGALALEGGRAEIRDCSFTTNSTDAGTYGSVTHLGGAIYAFGVNPLRITDSYFAGNYAGADSGGGCGGPLYLTGAGLTASVTRCVFTRNGNGSHHGDVHISGGTVALTNNLIVRSSTHGLWRDGGNATVANCTFANNGGWGFTNASGTVTAKNCIAWGNTNGGFCNVSVNFSSSQEAQAGTENMVVNPLFVDTTYYHLQSTKGNYVGGYFSGGSWAESLDYSPCLDAGDPTSPYALEPLPNHHRVNLGAYGNTTVASKSGAGGTVFILK